VVSGGPGSPQARHYSRGVFRPSSLSRALAALGVGVLVALGAAAGVPSSPAYAASAGPPDPTQPLVLRMRSITPDYIPDHGPIIIQGTITNDSDEEWTAINVEGFFGSTPITTPAELAAAAQTPVDADVGHRIAAPGTFDHLDSLQPGQVARFTVRLPRSLLTISTPGVYWFGVHALGATAKGRSASAAGRDRTFLPLVPGSVTASGRVEQTSLVLPVRAGVVRAPDGSVEDTGQWLHSLRTGALHDLVTTGRAAQGRPLTWVVDPAVVDVVRRLAEGNPPRTLATPTTKNPEGSPSPSPSDGASSSGSAASASDTSAAPPALTRAARRWLHRIHAILSVETAQVMGLPYGDLEVDTALLYDRPLLRATMRRTGRTLTPWRVPLTPIVAPPSGRMAGVAVSDLPRSSTVLLEDTGVRGAAPAAATVNDRRVVISSAGAAEGGPGPVDPLSPLALRQRVLSEAALRLLGDQQPLVVQLPTSSDHGLRRSFFSGLEVPWLRLTTLDGAIAGSTTTMSPARLRAQPPADPQLGAGLYDEANQAIAQGATLQSVLVGNTVLRREIFDETAGNTSYSAARDAFAALSRVRATSTWVTDNLGSVDLAAPPKVTLASANGHFSALVSNALDVPVTVRIRATADSQIKITGGDPVELPPHGRTSVLLNASTHILGVHTVTLELTNQAGTPLGAQDTFPIRAEGVSRLIWVIIGAGVVLLFGAIVVRLTRRVLRSRAS
jgi:hypothetical protein